MSGSETTKQPKVRVIQIVLMAVSVALVFVSTYAFIFPIPSTEGYFNFGDVMIFATAMTFGGIVGGVGGAVGSSLSDVLGGFSTFAPFTFVVKGLEGFVAGVLARRKFPGNYFIAWLAAGAIMVVGYFLTESFFIALLFGASETTGVLAALGEVPFNLLQVVAGGLVGIPVSSMLKRRLPTVWLPRESKNPTGSSKTG